MYDFKIIEKLKDFKNMQVDFNSLRKKTANVYNCLVDKLTENIQEDEVLIKVEDIEDDVHQLRFYISGLLCCYNENDDSIRDLSDEVELKIFNK